MYHKHRLALGLLLLTVLAACGGAKSDMAAAPPAATAPTVTTQPANISVAAGATATFSVTATGTAPLTYQWSKGAAAISGATAASYTTPATVAGDNAGTYSVVVTNSIGAATSNTATLTVTAAPPAATAPTITTQPANIRVAAGATATFSVTATGTAPLTYQWKKGATAIGGATAASYTTPATVIGDNAGKFSVVVTNAIGTATSTVATLTVTAATAGTDVLTYKNDLNRSGQNLTESTLNLTNVTAATFGLLRTLSVNGKVDAQPLYVSKLNVGGAMHNVVFVATEHDSVYAFDADTSAILWQRSLLGAGEALSDTHGCGQVVPEIGITSTPVIDRSAGTHGTIYIVAMSKDASSNYHQRLHALDLTTGAEVLGGPTEIAATSPTSGSGMTTFDPGQYEERAALLLLSGTIYTSWTSHCDVAPYTGWVITYTATTLARTGVLNLAPNSGRGPAIWMSGGGPAADAAGNVYLLTANGAFETTMDANGFPSKRDYGNSFVKIANAGGTLSVADYFTMFNEVVESNGDLDLGSGGAMLLPDLMDSTGTVHHLVVGAGKDGNIYLVNRDSMGKFNAVDNSQIWQQLSAALTGGIWSTPAYFNGKVYYGAVSSNLKAFSLANAKLVATPQSQSTAQFAYPGTAPSVSANGSANAIVWAHENSNPAVLHAYDAANLAHELYNSNQAAANRDHFGAGNKYITPTVADGKVFVGTTNGVGIFGLLP